MRLNDASGVPHHHGSISAPVRAGEARPYSSGPKIGCKFDPHPPSP
jgi:hypothetical protein